MGAVEPTLQRARSVFWHGDSRTLKPALYEFHMVVASPLESHKDVAIAAAIVVQR